MKNKTHDWSDSDNVKLLTDSEVRHLVKTNQWQKLGKVFGFVPVYHFEGKNFIDWRCVPLSLINVLRKKVQIKNGFSADFGDSSSFSNKRKHLRCLMLSAQWELVKSIYGFEPKFNLVHNGKHVIDWSNLPWNIHQILKCGGVIKNTPYTLEGGIYEPKEKPKTNQQKVKLVPKHLRVKRLDGEKAFSVWKFLWESQNGVCHFCKQTIKIENFNVDHLTPISRGGTNDKSNLRGTCNDCNSNKSFLTEEEFMKSRFLAAKLYKIKQSS